MEITRPYGVRPFGIISLTPFKPRKLLNYELRLKVTHRDAVWLELGLSWFCHDNSNETDNNIVTIWWDNNYLGLLKSITMSWQYFYLFVSIFKIKRMAYYYFHFSAWGQNWLFICYHNLTWNYLNNQ